MTLGLIAAMCWGIHDITIRYLSSRVPILAALMCVLIVGAIFQFGVIASTGTVSWPVGTGLVLTLGSGVAFLIASLGLYFAFERGPVRLVAPLIASYPILSIGFAMMTGASISMAQGAAVLAVVAGVGVVAALSDDNPDDVPSFGPTIALSLMSAIGFATTFKLGQMAAEHSGELVTTLIARLTALLLLAVIILARRAPIWPGKTALLPLAVMGVLDGIALICVISAAPLKHPEHAAVASSTFGLLTVVLAWAFLRERMSMPQWTGCLIAFAGIGYLAL